MKTTYIHPDDQPAGRFRLLDWLDDGFKSADFDHFECLVAFAKISPFYKLHASIAAWNAAGKTEEAVIGVDEKGTSLQALQYALANFDSVQILHVDYHTFHPKLYIFYGPSKAIGYYGSGNFTTGGLETNFEGGTLLEFDLPADKAAFDEFRENFTSVASSGLGCCSPLTTTLLASIDAAGMLLDETKPLKRPASAVPSSPAAPGAPAKPIFGSFSMVPPRAIPKAIMIAAEASAGIVMAPVKPKGTPGKSGGGKAASGSKPTAVATPPTSVAPGGSVTIPMVVHGLAIQVNPHHNGEIFLSMRAIKQNPSFFGFPFTGLTTPKKPTNPAYPQRTPDPVVDINVYDASGLLANSVLGYGLNTVYYALKSEVRITVTPDLLAALGYSAGGTNYPMLVIRPSLTNGVDYDFDFYAYGSTPSNYYLDLCDQTLPGGGHATPRKLGWF